MDSYIKGYFCEHELGDDNDKIIRAVKCDKLIHQENTGMQELVVFDSDALGRCLALDGAMQLTEKDESSYQEMISFLALNSHPDPKKVLIVGGGDGGVIRECLKHHCVEEITLCEIDKRVVELSKKYLPFMSSSFDHPKVTVNIGDGYAFIRENKNAFDIIITDSSDPKGPAVSLFQRDYYKSLHECLRSGGIISCQAETIWYHLSLIKFLHTTASEFFKTVAYATTMVPTYPSGQIGFLLACKDQRINFDVPFHKFTEEQVDEMKLKYYSTEIHQAAFVLPTFVRKALQLAETP
ncbi:uncharacterized protein LOC128396961 [Panonychus citri]|uniref:uncharacterized protein LOC128396961 n=1 Tax=Panonychus citri TaxID=50023 RepID=UPI002307272C|nr:uncharacterized protein LOC128396961 [Panonychus citri]